LIGTEFLKLVSVAFVVVFLLALVVVVHSAAAALDIAFVVKVVAVDSLVVVELNWIDFGPHYQGKAKTLSFHHLV
jgi:hypothetical protein